MEARLANLDDFVQIKKIYAEIVADMIAKNLNIWDEIYPCSCFMEDIQRERLYVIENNGSIVSAFALCSHNDGNQQVTWHDPKATYLYLDRLGVCVKEQKKGMGALAIQSAMEFAKKRKIAYLRLFVVEENHAAINLYEKMGFQKAMGIYHEVIDDTLTLHELGYEIKIL